MASIKDIAKALNLSISTVSLALNNKPRVSKETRELVLAKAKELKYVKNGIAADLKRQRTNLILFIIHDASRSYFTNIINQLQKATSYFGYDFLICTTYDQHIGTAERFIKEHRADAIIIYTSTIPDTLIQDNARNDFPIVVLGQKVYGDNILCYGYKDPDETLNTTDYLIETGHQRIAFVKGSKVSLGTSRTFKKYQASLKKAHLAFDESIIFDADGSSYQNGYDIARKIHQENPPLDAIQFSTDEVAIGAMMYFKEHGIKIPDDLSIVGRNNIPEASFIYPSLTTSGSTNEAYPFYESLIHYLVMLIEKNEEDDVVALQLKEYLDHYQNQTELILRESVKKRN